METQLPNQVKCLLKVLRLCLIAIINVQFDEICSLRQSIKRQYA